MRKRVTIELEIERDFNSAIYAAIGDLLQSIEDFDFDVNDVKVGNVLDALKLDTLPLGTVKTLRSTQKRYGYTPGDEYDA